MRSSRIVAAWLACSAALAHAEAPVSVVAREVRGIRSADAPLDRAMLLVFVVDDVGDPIDTVAVSVLAGRRRIGSGATDGRGRALLRLTPGGPFTVRAEEPGLAPAEARGVFLRKGGLTALVLPLAALAAPAPSIEPPQASPAASPQAPPAAQPPGAEPPPPDSAKGPE